MAEREEVWQLRTLKEHDIHSPQSHLQSRHSAVNPIVLAGRSGGGAFVAAGVLGYHSARTANFNGSGKIMSHARISIDPAVMMGKPCIKGTRITVELILRKLGAGRSFADLLEAYPKLTEDDLRAALAFAADYMQHETVLAAE